MIRSLASKSQSVASKIVDQIFNDIKNYDYGVSLLVGGVDEKRGAQLFEIENPGNVLPNNDIGYFAIGAGKALALNEFINSEYHPHMSLEEVMAIVFVAKKKSEKVGGASVSILTCM